MILSIYRFIAGWLNVEFCGEQVSRFLNLCTRQGIHLWKVRKSKNGGVETCIYLNDVKRLRPGLRKTHVRFRILRKNGLPFVLHRYRKRKIFAGILLLVVIGTGILSTRVWRIEFVGNQSLSEETLLDYLEEHKIAFRSENILEVLIIKALKINSPHSILIAVAVHGIDYAAAAVIGLSLQGKRIFV